MSAMISPNGRVSFESVYEMSSMDPTKPPKYSVVLLFPKNRSAEQTALYNAMFQAANEVCQKTFGCNLGQMSPSIKKVIKSPFRDGAEKAHLDGYGDDVTFVRFSGKVRPKIINQGKGEITRESGNFYNGCWARLVYSTYSYNKGGNAGIGFGLGNIQKVADGPTFGASMGGDDVFGVVETADAPFEDILG